MTEQIFTENIKRAEISFLEQELNLNYKITKTI